MPSGSSFYKDLQRQLEVYTKELSGKNSFLNDLNSKLAKVETHISQIKTKLAAILVKALKDGSIYPCKETSSQINQEFEAKRKEFAMLQKELPLWKVKKTEEYARLNEVVERINDFKAKVLRLEAEHDDEKALHEDFIYLCGVKKDLKAKLDHSQSQYTHTMEMVKQALSSSFTSDPFFSYFHKKYGDNPVEGWLDQFVARKSFYFENREKYHLLLKLEQASKSHVDRFVQLLEMVEQEFLKFEDRFVSKVEPELRQAQADLEMSLKTKNSLKSEISKLEHQIKTTENKIDQMAADGDGYERKVFSILTSKVDTHPKEVLEFIANTKSKEDDNLYEELNSNRSLRSKLMSAIEQAKREYETVKEQKEDFEKFLRSFKSRGYNGSYSEISMSSSDFLMWYAQGVTLNSALSRIESKHVDRTPVSTYSSGSGYSSSSWGSSSSSSSSGFGSSSSFGGGGFSTTDSF